MKRILASIAVSAFPLLALAQTSNTPNSVFGLLAWFKALINAALPIIISLAVVWFVYNVFRYMIASEEEDKGKAKEQMIWGIVSIAVMVSVWGLVGILTNTFGTAGGNAIPVPALPTL